MTHQDILKCVQEANDEFDSNKINWLWLTLMALYNHAIENNYKVPHMAKVKLEREVTLPEVLKIAPAALHLLRCLRVV